MGHFVRKFQGEWGASTNDCWRQKTRVPCYHLALFAWSWFSHLSRTPTCDRQTLHAIKRIYEILLRFETTAKMFKKIESKFQGFWPLQKLEEGWAKFSRCVIEFDVGPNMRYNFYDALLGSLGDRKWGFLKFPAPLKLRPYGAIQMCILLLLLLKRTAAKPKAARLLTYVGRPNKIIVFMRLLTILHPNRFGQNAFTRFQCDPATDALSGGGRKEAARKWRWIRPIRWRWKGLDVSLSGALWLRTRFRRNARRRSTSTSGYWIRERALKSTGAALSASSQDVFILHIQETHQEMR